VSLELFDTHAHLDDDRFRDDLEQVLARAAAAGVSRIMTIATTAASSVASTALAANHSSLRATVGIQPNHVAQAAPSDWDQVARLVESPCVAGVGETGLDRHWDYTPFAQQEDYFARHLELARRRQLPVVVHCRQAEADVVRMLQSDFERHGPVRGVMHSFTGDVDTANACVQMGLYVSFAGMITYKNADALRAVAARIPVDCLLVETDSPYLAPVPRRGQRNEPAFMEHTLVRLAEVRAVPAVDLAAQVTLNARRLFEPEG
jgi:TatD DNase family protein